MIDYARPLIDIERLTKAIHEDCLNRNYHGAVELSTALAVEVKLLQSVLKIMDEEKNGSAV
jgi:hypothetical protein